MNSDYKKYEELLKKHNYPLSSKEELLEIINNLKALAEVIKNFEKGRKKIKNHKICLNLKKKGDSN